MNIGILTIATGNYSKLFPNFKKEIIEKFLPIFNKNIFLFTDDLDVHHNNLINIMHLPWPLCTLLRFHYINKHEKLFLNFDYLYYIDVDMIPYSLIDEEVLPDKNEIVCALHYWQQDSFESYENSNSKSTAFVNLTNQFENKYCQGCFFGAKTDAFLSMSTTLEKNINEDLKNNIIAKWHDESHLNKYIISHPYKALNSGYTHPHVIPIDQNKNKVKFIHKNANSFGLN